LDSASFVDIGHGFIFGSINICICNVNLYEYAIHPLNKDMKFTGFKDYLINEERRTASKTGLYPLGYGGIGLYPAADWIPQAADAMLYITMDERLYKNGDGAPFSIKHIPGPLPPKNPNSGVKAPFPIEKLWGPNPDKKFHTAGEDSPFSIQHLK